jgi:polysaccharide biosynthesis PFTS motif protein
VISDELWVWNEAARSYYERRRASTALPFPRIRVTGAMMCGDARHFGLAPAEARRRIQLPEDGFLISIFDVSGINEEWRRRFGGGPVTIEQEFAEAFYVGLRRMLEAFSGVSLILKLKRQLGARFRDFPPELYRLIDPGSPFMREGRIRFVDVNCDPFLPIAAGNACLGMPCTSPVLVALSSGRPAAFFDPLQILGYCPEPGLRMLALRSQAALHEAVAGWLSGSGPRVAPPHALTLPPRWRDDGLFPSEHGGAHV